MKKLFVTLLIATVSVCAFAQKGQMAIGANLSYTPCLEKGADLSNFGVSAKFQYNFTDALRGELNAGYDFKDKGVSFLTAAANFHYLFNLGEKFKIYPIVGVGFAHISFDYSGWAEDVIDDAYGDYLDDELQDLIDEAYKDAGSDSENKLLVNAGLGAEYDLSDNFSLCAEVKYQYIKDCCRLPISIGFAYKF